MKKKKKFFKKVKFIQQQIVNNRITLRNTVNIYRKNMKRIFAKIVKIAKFYLNLVIKIL